MSKGCPFSLSLSLSLWDLTNFINLKKISHVCGIEIMSLCGFFMASRFSKRVGELIMCMHCEVYNVFVIASCCMWFIFFSLKWCMWFIFFFFFFFNMDKKCLFIIFINYLDLAMEGSTSTIK